MVVTDVYEWIGEGGAYSHRRAKYFGPYAQKRVEKIYQIDAVVSIGRKFSDGHVKWKNVNTDNQTLLNLALSKVKIWNYRIKENESVPLQVFLFSGGAETHFVKSSSGGMQQSKIYFWDIARNV